MEPSVKWSEGICLNGGEVLKQAKCSIPRQSKVPDFNTLVI